VQRWTLIPIVMIFGRRRGVRAIGTRSGPSSSYRWTRSGGYGCG